MRQSGVRKTRTILGIAALLGAFALVSSGCALTQQPGHAPEPKGFLGDYSQLKPGGDDRAGLVYIAPDAGFAKYDSVLIDSVSVWHSTENAKLTDEEAQALSDYLYSAVHDELAKDYKIVTQPAANTMRIRMAITEALGAEVFSNTITSVIPQLRLISKLSGMAADKRLMVGAATVEVEITDSITNRRLAAAVDERWGNKALRGGIAEWSDVKSAFDFWAELMRTRLAEERAR